MERSTVLYSICGGCREGSFTIRPSPYSQWVHRCFFPMTYTDCLRIRLSFTKSTCNFNNINWMHIEWDQQQDNQTKCLFLEADVLLLKSKAWYLCIMYLLKHFNFTCMLTIFQFGSCVIWFLYQNHIIYHVCLFIIK
jgi:hypothetical protein